MIGLERARRIVGHYYAKRMADAATFNDIEILEREIDRFNAKIARRRKRGHRNGREIIGQVIRTGIIGFSMAISVSWYNYTEDGYCLQVGLHAFPGNTERVNAVRKQFCTAGGFFDFTLAGAPMIEAAEQAEAPVTRVRVRTP